jgi:fumarate reductase subunit D
VSLIHRLEPLFWALFGAGGFVAALLLPGLVFGLVIAAPLGLFDPGATAHHRMYGLAANPLGRLILFATITLVLWHAAHHTRHLLLDLGLKRLEGPICYVLYGLAGLGTLAAVSGVASL